MEFAISSSDDDLQAMEDPELAGAIMKCQAAATIAEAAGESLAKAKHELVEVMTSRGLRSENVITPDGVYRATVVRSERTKIDDEGLKASLGARAWNKLTRRVVDRGLLEQAVAKGRVDPEVAAKHVTISTMSAFPKLTRLDGEG